MARNLLSTSIPVDKGKEKEESPGPLSESAGALIELCPNCATKYTKNDIVALNPGSEEQETLRFALERRREQEPGKRKSKKRKNESDEAPPRKKQETASATSRSVTSELEKEEVKRKANMSAAVKSLYGGSSRTETFMTRTFTRYA